jgi:uncharacterized membrane protein YdbT with pleckstrin-like domain
MGYVENNLLPNEKILHKAKIHWIIYRGAILPIFALFFMLTDYSENRLLMYVVVFFGLVGLLSFLVAIVFVKTTELVVTSKRVIAKFGVLKRKTIELNHSRVESLQVSQSIFERILNSGTILIQGTGGSRTPIPTIKEPLLC